MDLSLVGGRHDWIIYLLYVFLLNHLLGGRILWMISLTTKRLNERRAVDDWKVASLINNLLR